MTELSWSYEGNDQVAMYRGLRIRAVHDDHPENPFKSWEGHWPMVVYHDRSLDEYDSAPGARPLDPLCRFTDASLVLLQKHIADAISASAYADLRYHMDIDCDVTETPKWVTDPVALANWFDEAWNGHNERDKLGDAEKLYELLNIPCLKTTVHGCSQGDWAELLIVASPEAQAELRSKPEDMGDDEWKATLQRDMEAQAQLYEDWAFGNCWGYVIESQGDASCPRCGNADNDGSDTCVDCDEEFEFEWEEIPDGSCWGYFGDPDESGLEADAINVANHHLSCDVTDQPKELAHG